MRKISFGSTISFRLNISFTVLFFFYLDTAICQTSETFFVPDSLKKYSFEELYDLQYSSINTSNQIVYANAYLNKAKNANDSLKIVNGYSQMAGVTDYNSSIIYSDSIITITKNWKNNVFPGLAFIIKGMNYFALGKNEKSLKSYLKLHQISLYNNNKGHLYFAKTGIAQIKLFWGNSNEALKMSKSALKILYDNEVEFKKDKGFYLNYQLISTWHQITNSYIFEQEFDSAYYYNALSIKNSLKIQDSIWYFDSVFNSGEIAYYNTEYDRALDSLNKAYPYRELPSNKLFHHYYMGSIYNNQKKEFLAFWHFNKADSIFNKTNDVVPEIKDIQHFFVNYYKEKGDIKNQLKYIDQLIHIDSIIDNNRIYLNETIKNEYDVPELLSEKEAILSKIKKEKEQVSSLNTVLLFLTILFLAYAFYNYRRKLVYKQKFNQFLITREQEHQNTSSIELEKNSPVSKKLNNISDEIVQDILIKLERFEKMNYYLNRKLTLANLAKRWNTNSSYLSKIINEHKQKSFSNYLSDLRIDYSIEKIISDKEFRKFKIEAIGLDVGFNNGKSFAKQFHIKTGVYPSFFIKEIERLRASDLNQTG